MSALGAAVIKADDARGHLVRKLDSAASELTFQANRIRAGGTYEGRKLGHCLIAIEEARQILDAYDTNVALLLKAGAA